MKTLEVRKLIEGDELEIEISTPIKSLMNEWTKRFEKLSGRKPCVEDYFYAGYILSNPTVAENLKPTKFEKNIDSIIDTRFN